MKRYLTLLFLAFLGAPVNAQTVTQEAWLLPIRLIVDGDTIGTTIVGLPKPLDNYKIRVYGIDTPEKGGTAKCNTEKELGKRATEVLHALAKDKREMIVRGCKHDKYGGRFVCKVEIGGKDVATELLNSGLAYEYYGGAKRAWCK